MGLDLQLLPAFLAAALAGGSLHTQLARHPFAARTVTWISGTLIGGLTNGLLLTSRKAA